MRITRFFIAPILAAFSAMAADTALLNMIMADARFVAGIDIDRAKASPLGKKFIVTIGTGAVIDFAIGQHRHDPPNLFAAVFHHVELNGG